MLCALSIIFFGIPISITHALIAKAIIWEEVGVHVGLFPRKSSYLERIPNKILATNDNLADVSSLLPKANIWHQLLVSNFQPREDALETPTFVDKHLIYFILSRTRVNLPLTICNFLRHKIIASYEGVSSLIPFGRVLFELFFQKDIIENMQELGLAEPLETTWSQRLDTT